MTNVSVANNLLRSEVTVSSDKVSNVTKRTPVISAMWIYSLAVPVVCIPDKLALFLNTSL